MERRELGGRILAAIDELTPEHKAAIILREIEGLSYEDISKVMQCSKGTVMSRLHYARKKLQAGAPTVKRWGGIVLVVLGAWFVALGVFAHAFARLFPVTPRS